MAKNRGPEPSKLTRYLLIARSAGRCQICNEFVLTDSFTTPVRMWSLPLPPWAMTQALTAHLN